MLKCKRAQERDKLDSLENSDEVYPTAPKDCITFQNSFWIFATVLEILALFVIIAVALYCRFYTQCHECLNRHRRRRRDKKQNYPQIKFTTEKAPKSNKKRVAINKQYVKFIDQKDHQAVYYYLTALVEDTWKDHRTRIGADAKGLSHTDIAIKGIYHIENKDLFDAYEASHKQASARYEIPDSLIERVIQTRYRDTNRHLEAANRTKTAKTDEIEESGESLLTLKQNEIRPLDSTEAYFFHGTDLLNINSIIKTGFKTSKAARGLYGHPGIYLAESSQKADQYADGETKRRRINLSMLLVRTSLGKTADFDPNEDMLNTCDTVMGGEGKRFREFVKRDTSQMYPEFLIIYDRVLNRYH